MSDTTKIEWCDSTFNPWIGCTKISPACDNCYAAVSTPARTCNITWGAGQPRRLTSQANWRLPVRWNARASEFGQCDVCGWRGERRPRWAVCPTCKNGLMKPARRRVFCASLADVFDNEADPQWRKRLFDLIAATPNLDWLLLTKRVGNVVQMVREATGSEVLPGNVWLGATIANQAEADRDIPKLLEVDAFVRFLSMEPLLGPVELGGHTESLAPGLSQGRDWLTGRTSQFSDIFGGNDQPWTERDDLDLPDEYRESRIHWVIAGGESGPKARPMHPEWVRSLRDQCGAVGVPFLFKQWGEWEPREQWSDMHLHTSPRRYERMTAIMQDGSPCASDAVPQDVGAHRMAMVGKKAAGRLLDGREHNGFPASII